jgi:GAF domain-containing protein
MKRRATTDDKSGKTQRRKAANPKRKPACAAVSRSRTSDLDLQTQLNLRTRELGESQEQLKATNDVLQAISTSGGDLNRVFQTVLSNATRLCKAKFGVLHLCEGENFRTVALHNAPRDYAVAKKRDPMIRGVETGNALDMVRETLAPVQVADVLTERAYTSTSAQARTSFVRTSGVRSLLAVPMLAGGGLIGVIIIYRQEVRPFTDKQIALVLNFAAQAVIAIENTRLLNELRQRTDDLTESLEQQTATSEVLKIISSSPGELKPVFQSMLESAVRVCDAKFGVLHRLIDGAFHTVAMYNPTAAYSDHLRQRGPWVPEPGFPLYRLLQTRQVITSVDQATEPVPPPSARLAGARSHIAVPMIKDEEVVGAITIYRTEVRPFSNKQIKLVQNFAAQAVIAIENTRLLSELRESLQQQTATADVLKIISRSTFDLAAVLDTLVNSAARLCEADSASINRQVGEHLRQVAHCGQSPELIQFMQSHPIPAGRGSIVGRTLQEARIIQIADVLSDPEFTFSEAAKIGGVRTMLGVPLLREGTPIGVIVLQRNSVKQFTAKQIELLATFADQAVIAIENVRLFEEVQKRTDELTESLAQQTATSEVLKVISSSPGQLAPVFDSLLSNATRICDARFGAMYLSEGDAMRFVAAHNAPQAWIESRQRAAIVNPHPDTGLGRIIRTKQIAHIPDIRQLSAYTARDVTSVTSVEIAGYRTLLAVPMLRDGALVGAITINRQEVRPFTDKQIELVQNFAAQAVIAIENARLLNELRQRTDDLSEALERQTATSEVLRVISSAPGDVQPVFEVMLENATRLCNAKFGTLYLCEGDVFRIVAMHGAPPAFAEERLRNPVIHPAPGTVFGRTVSTKQVAQIADIREEADHIAPSERTGTQLAALAGARTVVAVPMIKDNELVGAILIFRQEVKPFSDKQIELVQNFAAQAVIAIENTRLLNDLRQRTDDLTEALEQQTATSEVLKVISGSPGDLQPVFDSILVNATRICDASFGVLELCEGDAHRMVAMHNVPAAFTEKRGREPVFHPLPGSTVFEMARTKQVCQVADARAPGYPGSALVELAGARTIINVPMLNEDRLIGSIGIYRTEVRPFTEKQIELVSNFAAQAVIAIENVRLLNELRQRTDDLSESLEQQTATSEVLKVISSSPGELGPVFSAMLENATRICEATFGAMLVRDGEVLRRVALHNAPKSFLEFNDRAPLLRRGDAPAVDRAFDTKKAVQIVDTGDSDTPIMKFGGARTLLVVPMLKDAEPVGAIGIYRLEVRPFTDKQIELVSGFATQAVIAIENTRLLNELRQRTDDLGEALEQQTATAEVLKVISSSPGELDPVFEAMLENATRLCDAKFGTMYRYYDGMYHRVAGIGTPPPLVEYQKHRFPLAAPPNSKFDRLLHSKAVIHIDDDLAEPDPSPPAKLGGARSILWVPMVQDDGLVGAIVIYRQEVRPFTDKQIELVKNFAAQAVIAIENARLLNELRQRTDDLSESLEQQTATSEVLRVISSSPGHLEPVFDAIMDNAIRICGAKFGSMALCEGDEFRGVGLKHAPPAFVEERQRHPTFRPRPNSGVGRVMATKQAVQIADLRTDQSYLDGIPSTVALVDAAGARTLLAVPMLKDDNVVGVIGIYRQEVRPFTDKQVELVTNFASQAVIAIENTRLLTELRESLQQQTATADVLQVISSSPGELGSVFQAILTNATRLCEAKFANLFVREGDAFRLVAMHNAPPRLARLRQREPVIRPPPLMHMAATKQVIQIADLSSWQSGSQPRDPDGIAFVELAGVRTLLGVPMLKNNEVTGGIVIYRQDVRPFSDKQIELVSNFAAQAVIAIENARLLNELRESLQQQTATADVLKAISRSTFDLQAVLNALVESATRLCGADKAAISRPMGDNFEHLASYGYPPAHSEYMRTHPIPADRGSVSGRVLLEGKVVHIPDVTKDQEYTLADKYNFNVRTLLGVPLMREGAAIGVIILQRETIRPFTDKQIELATIFADQAGIAMENVRLFESVEARTRELAQSLEDLQTAQDRLVQTQKLASLGQLTAGIAHEIKNPLNFVNNFSSLSTELLDELQEALQGLPIDEKAHAEISELTETLRANLDKIEQHGKRADSIVKNMLLHSREGSGEHRPVDINAVVEESLNLAYHGARAEKQGFNITLERSLDPSAGEVDAFPQDITRVLLNLISNGFYAATKRKAELGDGYEPTLSAATKDLGDRVEIRIRDNGTGIPPEVKDKMFNPFFTTKPAGEGTGLGLSISHDIVVKQHAGSIEVDTAPGAFTEIRIVLPRTAASLAKSGGQA